MTTQEENLAQLNILKERASTYRAQLKEETDPLKRAALSRKLYTYKLAIQSVQVQIDRLDLVSINNRLNPRIRPKHREITWNHVEHRNETLANLEGKPWRQLETESTSQVNNWLAEGIKDLTGSQRRYIDAYYNQGLSMERIAQEYGVNKSTVSRTIKRGMAALGRWVEAGQLASACKDGQGGFNWQRFLEENPLLFPRQRQLMLLSMTQQNHRILGETLKLERSTVTHTLAQGKCTLRRLGLEWTVERQVTQHAGP